MPTVQVPTRLPWENRFEKPTLEDLVRPYEAQAAALFAEARKGLLGFEGAVEELRWQGVSWRWTLTYFASAEEAESTDARPFAFLIAFPETPRLAVPAPVTLLQSLTVRKVGRYIAEELARLRRVDDTHWGEWPLTARQNVLDLLSLIKRCREHLSAQPAS